MQEKDEQVKIPFKIHQLSKGKGIRNKFVYQKTHFVSPIFGTKVKDVVSVPFEVSTNIDNDKAYDAFRTVKRLTEEEAIKKYGTAYYEYTNLITNQTRKEYFNQEYEETPDPYEVKPLNEASIMSPITKHQPKAVHLSNPSQEIPLDSNQKEDDSTDAYFEQDTVKLENEGDKILALDPEEVEEEMEEVEDGIKISSSFFDQIEKEQTTIKQQKLVEPTMTLESQIKPKLPYQLPDVKIFSKSKNDTKVKPMWLLDQVEVVNQTLLDFMIEGRVFDSKKGPTVTRHEIALEPGVSVKKVNNIQDNLMMNLAATSVRIEAPIPGKPYVGIEVPNVEKETVAFGNIVDDDAFLFDSNPLKVALGMDIDGEHVYADIQSMPHGLIAGATNSGKSVCVNTILVSLLLKNSPETLKLLLIDPKMVELAAFNDIPHLLTPVITDPKMAAQALDWIVQEMERRYNIFSNARVRNIASYNQAIESQSIEGKIMPYIVIVIDELADLIMVASREVEDAIQRITQKARAAGIHLLVATQRPTTDVIKGTIKSNIPVRIAFKVASFVDSTTIIDGAGAETLLGKGDMLFKTHDSPKRLQGAYITDEEIFKVTDFIRAQRMPEYVFGHADLIRRVVKQTSIDPLFEDVARYVVEVRSCSINAIQKEFNCGFNRAQAIVDMLVSSQIVEASDGKKPKEVRISLYELEEILKEIL
jgi:S-DNA-T family DNA segregation ATPase FtsK/SpoIIIE